MTSLAQDAHTTTVAGMRRLTAPSVTRVQLRPGRLAGSGASRRGRAATMLEFALILPAFLFLLLFVIDMGHVILVSGAMDDAAFSAARTGAQLGGAGIDATGTGQAVCSGAGPCSQGSTYRSLTEAAQQIPGFNSLGHLDQMKIVHGAVCRDNPTDDHVEIQVHYSTRLLTPGLGGMLRLLGATDAQASTVDNGMSMSATAVARCQIIRSGS